MMMWLLVENLPRLVIEKDLDELFSRYGRVVSMQTKFASRENAIAFVEYASAKDAEEANRQLQGFTYNANRLRTELWRPSGDTGPRSNVATQHRIVISHLPPSATTKDVKDLLSAVADVLAVEVDRRGSAWATFATHYDVDRVVNKLDNTDYRGERLRVKRDELSILSTSNTAATSSSSNNASRSTTARSPSSASSRTNRYERTASSTRSRSRSRSPPRYKRRSSSRSPSRHRSSSDRRSRSRSRSPGYRSSSRRNRSRSRSR